MTIYYENKRNIHVLYSYSNHEISPSCFCLNIDPLGLLNKTLSLVQICMDTLKMPFPECEPVFHWQEGSCAADLSS